MLGMFFGTEPVSRAAWIGDIGGRLSAKNAAILPIGRACSALGRNSANLSRSPLRGGEFDEFYSPSHPQRYGVLR